MNSQEILWKVKALVAPIIDWEKLSLDSFSFSNRENITPGRQVGDELELFVYVLSQDTDGAEKKAEIFLSTFLALLAIEASKKYKFRIANITPIDKVVSKNGWVLLDSLKFTIEVETKYEDLDLSLLKKVNEFIQVSSPKKRKSILRALNFLYYGLNANINSQAFLSIYGGLNHLISEVGKAGKTRKREDIAIVEFIDKGLLEAKEARSWMEQLDKFHSKHYEVLYGENISAEELQNIKTFFTDFLNKFIEYQKTV